MRLNFTPILALCVLSSSAGIAQTYKVTAEWKLPGAAANTIAIDSESRKVFVGGDSAISVLNADDGSTLGSVPLAGAQSVLLIPAGNDEEPAASTTGFAVANGRAVRFNVSDLKIASEVKVATGPSSLCYDEDGRTVEVVDAGGTLTTLDAESGKLLKSAKVPTGAGEIACGTLSHVYVADTAANVVHVLNHETGRLDGDYPIMTGHKPSGLALDTKGRRLFVACEDGVIEIIDTDSGFTFIQLMDGSGTAHGTFAWTPQGKGQWKAAAFFTHADGTLSGVRMMAYINYILGGSYKLVPGATAIAYDSKTHHLLETTQHGGSQVVTVIGY